MTLTLKLLALTKAKLKTKVKTKVMDGWRGGEKGGLGQERRLNSCPWSFPGRCPAAGAPALECMATESGMVVAELRRLRWAPCPGLGSVNRVLDRRNDLNAILDMLSWNTEECRPAAADQA